MSSPPSPTISSLLTARALILLQLLSRLLTFGLNQALVRIAPPEVFGTAAIQFDLICSTTLFLSREGIRNALLRAPTSNTEKNGDFRRAQDRRLATIPFWLGIAISGLAVIIYLARLPLSTSRQRDFHLSLGLYVLSALLELGIEPHYVAALRSSPPKIRVRVQAEGGMAIAKAVVTVGCVVLFDKLGQGRPLLAFAVGQVMGAVWLAGRYIWEFGWEGLLWSSTQSGRQRFNDATSTLALANMRQSVVKHVLTEADRIAVGIICPLEDQGGYAIAMNYVARIIFQPLEETLLLHFSSSPASASSIRLLTLAIRLSSHLLLLLPAFLPPLLPVLTPLLLPRRYLSTSAPAILETYLKAYIPLLSLNGILEAYHAATATPEQVKTQIKWMVGSSLGFVGALALKTLLGGGGQTEATLIYASCLAMVIRIVYALRHARRRAKANEEEMKAASIVPKVIVVGAAAGSAILLRLLVGTGRWEVGWKGRGELLGTGVVLGLSTLGVIALAEKGDVVRVWRGKAE